MDVPQTAALLPLQVVRPAEVFQELETLWNEGSQEAVQEVQSPAGEINGVPVFLIKLRGGYGWHYHEAVDELFFVLDGQLLMKLRDGDHVVGPGEFLLIPHGVEHSPNAVGDLKLLLVEPRGAEVIYAVPTASAAAQPVRVNLAQKLSLIDDHWNPRVLGMVNDLAVKLVKLQGEFDWHHHATEDELFFVLQGRLTMKLRDRELTINPGEFIVVPHGVEHLPIAEEEVHLLLIEPKTTLNTGMVETDRTRRVLQRL